MSEETRKGKDWYVTFALLVVVSFVVIYALTGQDALGAAGRFIWNGLVLVGNGIVRIAGGMLNMVARGVGWRRLSRLATVFTSVGLGYAASVVVNDTTVGKARGLRGKLQTAIKVSREKWQNLPLVVKLLIVAALIASQIYLHFLLVVFPIAFLVPVVRKLWVRVADVAFGGWYWKTLGNTHRTAVATMRRLPLVRPITEGFRLLRLQYLYAWRLWRYDPRYRNPETDARHINLMEPFRLWWRGELDGYVGRPLLSGAKRASRRPEEVRE